MQTNGIFYTKPTIVSVADEELQMLLQLLNDFNILSSMKDLESKEYYELLGILSTKISDTELPELSIQSVLASHPRTCTPTKELQQLVSVKYSYRCNKDNYLLQKSLDFIINDFIQRMSSKSDVYTIFFAFEEEFHEFVKNSISLYFAQVSQKTEENVEETLIQAFTHLLKSFQPPQTKNVLESASSSHIAQGWEELDQDNALDLSYSKLSTKELINYIPEDTKSLNLSQLSIDRYILQKISTLSQLHSLFLRNCNEFYADMVFKLPTSLKMLDLTHCIVLDSADFSPLIHLETLVLSSKTEADYGDCLPTFPSSLKYLDLSNCIMELSTLKDCLETLPQLQVLSLKKLHLSKDKQELIRSVVPKSVMVEF